MKNLTLALLLIMGIVACSKQPYSATNKLYKAQAKKYANTIRQSPLQDSDAVHPPQLWVGTTNFNMRKPNFVVIHHTAQNNCEQTLKTFTMQKTQVSAHYVICKDGTVHHMLNDYLRAWHAGVGRWGNVTDVNSSSIGIELDNNGFERFPDAQMASLMELLAKLKKNYSIPAANFIGHADIAPVRKNDPNVYFDWKSLADNGFGLWYNDTTNIALPANFNAMHALRIVGYDIKDTTAAIVTFKRKYLKQDNSRLLTEGDNKVLFMLMQKFL